MPRAELRTKTGTLIVAQCDLTPGNALLNLNENLTLNTESEYEPDWEGETTMYWDAQEPERKYGEALYVDETGNHHLAGDLIVTITNTDENGNKTTTTHPYTAGTVLPYPQSLITTLTPAGKAARATELAHWITSSAKDAERNTITPEARDRIQARAHHYAELEGITNLLERILTALRAT